MALQLTSHDPDWASRYESERGLLERAIGPLAIGGIHHVGSTAVPGVDAEPVIDVLAGVAELPLPGGYLDSLADLEYLPAGGFSHDAHHFCKPKPDQKAFELHLVPVTSPRFAEMLAFRDYLRDHGQAAMAFAWMKRDLAHRCYGDRNRYVAAKGELIEVVLARLGSG